MHTHKNSCKATSLDECFVQSLVSWLHLPWTCSPAENESRLKAAKLQKTTNCTDFSGSIHFPCCNNHLLRLRDVEAQVRGSVSSVPPHWAGGPWHCKYFCLPRLRRSSCRHVWFHVLLRKKKINQCLQRRKKKIPPPCYCCALMTNKEFFYFYFFFILTQRQKPKNKSELWAAAGSAPVDCRAASSQRWHTLTHP